MPPTSSTEAHSTDPWKQDAAKQAFWAVDPPGDQPRLWCENPPFDDCPLIGEQLLMTGWALSPSSGKGVSVEVELDVGDRVNAHIGVNRADVRDALPDEPSAVRSGWLLRLTTSGWRSGLHELTITARDGEGNETKLTRRVNVDPKAEYRAWLAHRQATLPAPEEGRRLAQDRETAPHFLVCLMTSEADSEDLRRTLRSLESQTYPRWDLVITGLGASIEEGVEARDITNRSGEGYDRVDDLAAGLRRFLGGEADYVVLAQAGDVIAPHALLSFAERALAPEPPQLLYTDTDVLDGEGERSAPFFKPGWSPELLLSMDYIGPFTCVARESVHKGVDLEPSPVQSVYELLLRLIDEEQRVDRIPDVLYTRANGVSAPEDEGRLRELIDAVARRRARSAEVIPLDYPGTRRVAWKLEGGPKVSIIIPTAFTEGLVFRCVDSIRERTTYSNYEVVLVANNTGRAPPDVDFPGNDCRVVSYDGAFSYSAVNNAGARAATGDYLLFVNDDTEVDSPDWIERLLEQAQQPRVGVTGGKLLFPDGTLQLGGVLVMDDEAGAKVAGTGFAADDPGYHGLFTVVRNTSSVGGACMMISRELYGALGGFEEQLPVELGDVDLCLRALRGGDRVVWTPLAVLRHHERASRGGQSHPRDHSRFRQRWRRFLEAGDPYYNPNLSTTEGEDYQHRKLAGQPLPAGAAQPADEERPSEERFVPETMRGLIRAEHEARYRWAASAVAGKEVLDAGCGVGYGAEMLAEAGASRVVGIDLSAEAVEDADFRAGAIGEFVVGDLRQLPFSPRSFDVVVCFEAIEHVDRGELVLDEFRRILRGDGILILSSPNRTVYLPGNPYHVHEYTPSELHAALAKRFPHVALYRQHPWMTSLITDDAGLGAASSEVEIPASVRKVVGATAGEELYTLAVAGEGPLPELKGTAVLTDAFDLRSWHEKVTHLQAQLEATERVLEAEMRASREALEALGAVESSVSWRVTSPLRSAKRRFAEVVPSRLDEQ